MFKTIMHIIEIVIIISIVGGIANVVLMIIENVKEKKRELAKKKEAKWRKENRPAYIEQVKAQMHEAVHGQVYVHGDERYFSGNMGAFIVPPVLGVTDEQEVVDELAETGNPEAQCLWALKRVMGFVKEPHNEDLAIKRLLSAAHAGVVPAIIYCLDSNRKQNRGDEAVKWLTALATKDKETAQVIQLEWKREGFYYDMEPGAYAELVACAEKGNIRAQWYLDSRGLKYNRGGKN